MNVVLPKDLPRRYRDGIIEYQQGVDTIPSWPELMELGYTWEEHHKLLTLYQIERMKHGIKENEEINELSEEEIEEVNEVIDELIEKYNNI